MAEKKPNIKTVLIIIAGIIGYSLMLFVLNPYIQKQEKPKEKVENKVVYVPSDITKKYPKDFADKKELLKKIKAQIANKYQSINEGKQTSTYKDSNGRVVYIKIEEIKAVKNFLGGKSGYSFKRFYPDEEGYLYDTEGKVIKKIEIKSSYESCYFVSSLDDIKRKSYFDDEETGGTLSIITIGYDEKGNRIREERVKPSSWYEKEITEYSNGKKKAEKKIIDYEVDAEEYNKIYVEITKEYDETEKLIKKFVLRKNKFNAVRSETNFDLIKGEIITKYYEGDKVFATVTETLIGKDREIVKRERAGDEFVIWDEYELKKVGNNLNNFYNRIIIINNQSKYYYENYKDSINWKYNEGKKGITKDSYKKEHLLTQDINLDEGRSLSKEKEFYELEYDEKGNLYKVYQKRYKDKLKLEEELWDKDLANDMLDKTYKARIQKHLIEKEINKSKIEEKINNMKNRLLGGLGNEY